MTKRDAAPLNLKPVFRALVPISLMVMTGLACLYLQRPLLQSQLEATSTSASMTDEAATASVRMTEEALEGPADVEVNTPSGALEGLPGEIPPGGFAEEQIPEGLGGGAIQITLLWLGDADIDLHVTDPFGEEIYFGHDTSASGGFLDHDTIPCGSGIPQPVENVFWPTGGAPSGHYMVAVHYYSRCETPFTTPFEVIVRLDGQIYDRITGSINESERLEVTAFDY
jgi:hypothetical protein